MRNFFLFFLDEGEKYGVFKLIRAAREIIYFFFVIDERVDPLTKSIAKISIWEPKQCRGDTMKWAYQ